MIRGHPKMIVNIILVADQRPELIQSSRYTVYVPKRNDQRKPQ